MKKTFFTTRWRWGLIVGLGVLTAAVWIYTQALNQANENILIEAMDAALPRRAFLLRCSPGTAVPADLKSVFPLTAVYSSEKGEWDVRVDMGLCHQYQLFQEPDFLSDFLEQAAALTTQPHVKRVNVYLKTREGRWVEFHEPDLVP